MSRKKNRKTPEKTFSILDSIKSFVGSVEKRVNSCDIGEFEQRAQKSLKEAGGVVAYLQEKLQSLFKTGTGSEGKGDPKSGAEAFSIKSSISGENSNNGDELAEFSILKSNLAYKPFNYPWAYDRWRQQQAIHWLAQEVNMCDDVADWANKLTEAEKSLLTQIFRFFTQADVDVCSCYVNHYLRHFKSTEIRMMLVSFANMETIHIDAYSHLLDTIGMPEVEYLAFTKYSEMKTKHEYMLEKFNSGTLLDLAKTMAVYGAFVEGMQLFSAFAMLLNFPRFGKMKGMGQIVTWSMRDETLHTESIIQLFRTIVEENPEIWNEELRNGIYKECDVLVGHEDAFIDLAFGFLKENYGTYIEGMVPEGIKLYIRYIANRRLIQLGLQPIYAEAMDNPLPWLPMIANAPEHANFFESRATEYSKAATKGNWEEAFDGNDARFYGEIAKEQSELETRG